MKPKEQIHQLTLREISSMGAHADAYLNHAILTQNYRNDALHIAAATIAGIDLLIS